MHFNRKKIFNLDNHERFLRELLRFFTLYIQIHINSLNSWEASSSSFITLRFKEISDNRKVHVWCSVWPKHFIYSNWKNILNEYMMVWQLTSTLDFVTCCSVQANILPSQEYSISLSLSRLRNSRGKNSYLLKSNYNFHSNIVSFKIVTSSYIR